MGIDPRTDLAVQLPGLQLNAEGHKRIMIQSGPRVLLPGLPSLMREARKYSMAKEGLCPNFKSVTMKLLSLLSDIQITTWFFRHERPNQGGLHVLAQSNTSIIWHSIKGHKK